MAAADSGGEVDDYAPSLQGFRGWGRCAVTMVDLEALAWPYLHNGSDPHRTAHVTPGAHAAALRLADDQVGRILAALPAGTNVMIAGLSDLSDIPHLRAVIAHGPAFRQASYLHAPSTRRDGMTILPDLTATVLAAAGVPRPSTVVGVPWTAGGPQHGLAGAAARLRGQDVAAQCLRVTIQGFFIVLVVAQLLVYALAALALRGLGRRGRVLVVSRALAVTRALALAGAAVPVATYLANLLPWWKAGNPDLAMFGAMGLWALVLVGLALGGPWRRSLIIPGTVIAGITALTLAVDLTRGSPLQMNSLMGYSPLVGGRYYGLSNIAFATFATGTLMFAAGVAHLLQRRGRRGWAVAAVLVLGLGADALSGSPVLGAKFGGTIALIPGTAVTALVLAGKRVTAPRLVGFGAVGVAVMAVVCWLDYLRPPDRRTHLGRFAQQVADGRAGPVVTRKALAMLHTVGNIPLTLLAAGALLFLFLVLLRTGGAGGRAGPLAVAYDRAPALRAALTGTLVTSMCGFAVEDSGIAVPAIALTLAVPLAFSAAARALTERPPHVRERTTAMVRVAQR